MNKGVWNPNQRPANQKAGTNQTCPHCNNRPSRPKQHRPGCPRKQQFSPLERIGITISNKLGTSFKPGANRQPPATIHDLDCGDHICVERFQPTAYTHHGLYLGFGMVVHYDFHEITIVTIDEFSNGRKIYKVNSPVSYSPEMVMARAATRIGEHQYNLMTNNCEHFVRWCRNGQEIRISNPESPNENPFPMKKRPHPKSHR